jgi:nucleotide-binding universal stress UspA family protein
MRADGGLMIPDRIAPAATLGALPRRFDVEEHILPRFDAARTSGWPRRILVGTDGTQSAVPAVEAARAIAERRGIPVEMETVYRPRVPLPWSGTHRGIDECEHTERRPAVTLLHRVRRQRRELRQYAQGWPLRFEIGDPATVIARAAAEGGCDLVVAGIGHFDPVGARCDGRTVTRVARQIGVPLLAAKSGCESPTRCVIALPDGQVHAPTIRAALRLLPPDGPVWIAMPDRFATSHPELIASGSARELVAEALGEVMASDEGDRHVLERVDVAGDMLCGVLRLAEEAGADLIAVPNRGAPGQVRVFLPNVAEPLLVAAPCSVLIVPDEIVIP